MAAYRDSFQNDRIIDDVISISRKKLVSDGVPEEDIDTFTKIVDGYREADEKEKEIRASRGSCPFVDSSCIPKIRKFRNPLKLEAQLEKVKKMNKDNDGAMPFGMPFGIKPDHNQFGEYSEIKGKAGACPMGFVGPKPENHSDITNLSEAEIEDLKKQQQQQQQQKLGFFSKSVILFNSQIRPFLPSPLVAASTVVAIFSVFFVPKLIKMVKLQ